MQYWLEQNARMLGATIQALEVQRMTLSTLQTMNVQMSDLRDVADDPGARRSGSTLRPTRAGGAPRRRSPSLPPKQPPDRRLRLRSIRCNGGAR